MDTKVNFTVVGIFVVALSLAFIVMVFWLSDARHDQVYNTYLTYVHEDVTGLSVQSPVRFNGVEVGYVSAIVLDDKNPQLVQITLKVKAGTPITTSTVVTLMPMGITGVVYAGLKAQTPNAPLLLPTSSDPYPVLPFHPSFLMQLGKLLPELADNMKSISHDISKVFDEKNRRAFSSALQNISVVTKHLANNSEKLDDLISSLDQTLENTAQASKQFPAVLTDLQHTLASVQGSSAQINAASRKVQGLAAQGSVMVNNLNTQLLPAAEQTLSYLKGVMLNLGNLTQEATRNPAMFIRGKAPASPGPGETHQ